MGSVRLLSWALPDGQCCLAFQGSLYKWKNLRGRTVLVVNCHFRGNGWPQDPSPFVQYVPADVIESA